MTTPAPGVPDFIAGYGPQQSDFQNWWVNAAAFFQQRVIFRATQTGSSTTLPSSGANTLIAFDNIIEDPYGGWNSGTHHWLAPVSGYYQTTVTVWLASPGALQIVLSAFVSGSAASNIVATVPLTGTCIASSAPGGSAEATWVFYMVAGQDSVWGGGSIQNAAGGHATSLTPGQNSSIEVVWIGA